ncbi:hypothetical protein E2C01_037672 [Portunus trituberculatus]|uniref:Regulatory protein zeste n=1 Tax=Portunus trituberculatus TaxID=210409 RepID=A0A5B7FFX7_PORTR|nr:hypothetical protein [Portunus trituberculatus]
MDKHHYSGEREISLLTELIQAHKDILLDKRTDHSMIAKKSKTWKKVTSHFNAEGNPVGTVVLQIPPPPCNSPTPPPSNRPGPTFQATRSVSGLQTSQETPVTPQANSTPAAKQAHKRMRSLSFQDQGYEKGRT